MPKIATADRVNREALLALEPLVEYYRAISGEHPDRDDYRAMTRQGKALLRITLTTCGPVATGGFPAGPPDKL